MKKTFSVMLIAMLLAVLLAVSARAEAPRAEKITAKQKYVVIKVGEKLDLDSLYSVEPANANKTLKWTITENPWQKANGLVSSASIETKGPRQLLVGNYTNYLEESDKDKIIITGTTTDGSNKSISFDVYVIPENGIALDLCPGYQWETLPHDMLGISFPVRNFAYGKENKAFEICVKCTEYSGSEKEYKVVTNIKVASREAVYADAVTVENRSKIESLDWWVSTVWYSDGETCSCGEAPESEWNLASAYFPWPSEPENNQAKTTIIENQNVKTLIASCPAIGQTEKKTVDFYDSERAYKNDFPNDDDINTWSILLQNDGVTVFFDEVNTVATVVRPKGTAEEMLAIIQWRIALLEALPAIQKEAQDQGITLIAEMTAKGSSDYSTVVDADGKIDLLDQEKFDQVLEILHGQQGLLEVIAAFGTLDTNGK